LNAKAFLGSCAQVRGNKPPRAELKKARCLDC
jgi:hypothetical protein